MSHANNINGECMGWLSATAFKLSVFVQSGQRLSNRLKSVSRGPYAATGELRVVSPHHGGRVFLFSFELGEVACEICVVDNTEIDEDTADVVMSVTARATQVARRWLACTSRLLTSP